MPEKFFFRIVRTLKRTKRGLIDGGRPSGWQSMGSLKTDPLTSRDLSGTGGMQGSPFGFYLPFLHSWQDSSFRIKEEGGKRLTSDFPRGRRGAARRPASSGGAGAVSFGVALRSPGGKRRRRLNWLVGPPRQRRRQWGPSHIQRLGATDSHPTSGKRPRGSGSGSGSVYV
jgi:hypothetical protein